MFPSNLFDEISKCKLSSIVSLYVNIKYMRMNITNTIHVAFKDHVPIEFVVLKISPD